MWPCVSYWSLNRLEHTPRRHASKYHRIDCDGAQVDALLVDLFLEAHRRAPREIVLDLDNSDISLHGMQEGRFYHGYCMEHCYLRSTYSAAGTCCWPAKGVRMLRAAMARSRRWRALSHRSAALATVRIILRADSGFSNDELMVWCEANRVDYVFGWRAIVAWRRCWSNRSPGQASMHRSGRPARVFRDLQYRTLDSWSRTRRVVGKAEHTMEGANPRFIVTSLKRTRVGYDARAYPDLYCARGEAENRVGEQFELFADHASSAHGGRSAPHVVLGMAYVLVDTLRRVGLRTAVRRRRVATFASSC